MREDLSPLLKSVFICYCYYSKANRELTLTFQKPIESSPNISKANIECPPLFSMAAREFQYIHQPIGKRGQKICEKIQPIEKKEINQRMLSHFLKTQIPLS